jgi:shikimate dehydrogenase
MISGSTRLAAVIGDPVRHSLSPAIHNAAFAAADLDWVYVALPVATGDGHRAVEAMRTFGIDGLSVTMPHKAVVADAADDLTTAARSLGVANTLFRRDDRIVGDSTDGDGLVAAYRADFGSDLADRRVLVVGAGGAAASIVEAVGRAGAAEIVVTNRTAERAAKVADLAPQARSSGPLNETEVAAYDVVVNATPVGMAGGPDPDGIPVPADGLRAGQHVIDTVYKPSVTPLLAAASAAGATVAGGTGMLLHQAALQFERWTGQPAPLPAMHAALDRAR